MGLRSVALRGINAAFRAAGDAASTVIYRNKTQGAYNAATDTQGQTDADTPLDIIYDFKNKDNESGDVNIDTKSTGKIEGIIKAADLATPPKTEDLIVDGTILYKIKGIEPIGPFSDAVGYTLTLVKDSG